MCKARLPRLTILAAALLVLSLIFGSIPVAAQTSRVTNKSGFDVSPQLLEDGRILWQGWEGQDYEIYSQMPGEGPTQLTNNSTPDVSPQMNAVGHLVWMNWDGNDWEVWYNVGGGLVRLTNNTGYDTLPQISANDQIYWQGWDGHDYEIYRFNVQTRVTTKITDNDQDDVSPQINPSGQLTWVEWDGKNWQVFYDLGSGSVKLTNSTNGSNLSPQITDNGQIYWQGWDGQDYEIYCYKSLNGATEQLTNNTVDDITPAVKNGVMVWSQWDGHNWQISQEILSTGLITKLTNDNNDNKNPRVNASGQLVWQKWDGQDWEIYHEVLNYPYFSWENDVLTISTNLMVLKFSLGAVTYVKDLSTGEEILDGSLDNLPDNQWGFIGYAASPGGNVYDRQPSNANVSYAQKSINSATLTYGPCASENWGGFVAGSSLNYQFDVDRESGEINIGIVAVEPGGANIPYTLDLPIMNFRGPGVIIGAKEVLHANADVINGCIDNGGPVNSPALAVLEGNSSCIGVWTENQQTIGETVTDYHYQSNYDHIVLHSNIDPKQQVVDNHTVYGGTWRFTTQPTWLDIAKRWRERFGDLNPDAQYLWANANETVRDIHATHWQGHRDDLSQWAKVAAVADPTNVLLWLDFNDSIIFPGDYVNRMTFWRPTSSEIATIQSYGWPLQGYYTWDMYVDNMAQRLIDRAAYLPEGYTIGDFDPQYAGDAANWLTYWSPVSIKYYSTYYNVIHPASAQMESYIDINYPGYCNEYKFFGCYWDILGENMDSWRYDYKANFSATAYRVINGNDYMTGAKKLVESQYATFPIMSEYASNFLLPYCWYTWEGIANPSAGWSPYFSAINHPLRTALIGSYQWASDPQYPQDDYPHDKAALLGTLPIFVLDTDWNAPKNRNYQTDSVPAYLRARANLFVTYELYNDLPATWVKGALAYYRSNTGNMFRFEWDGKGGYQYVEETENGDVVRLKSSLQ